MSRQIPGLEFKKEVRPGDFKQASWVQYMNCVNSLNTLESLSLGAGGSQKFETGPSWKKFEGNVQIMYAMLKGRSLLDDEFKKMSQKKDDEEWAVTVFAAETDLLIRKVFAEKTEDLGMV